MAKRVSVQRLWYQNSIWLVFEKATMKCTLDNFMMTCRILGCFYLFIVVIVTYTTAVILPSNMTTVQVICWIFNQLRKTLPIVKIVYLIVYDIQAWNKFVDRYILVANGIKMNKLVITHYKTCELTKTVLIFQFSHRQFGFWWVAK